MDSKFKAGDVFKFEGGMKAIVANVFTQAANSNVYLYDLWSWYEGAIDWDRWPESELVDKAKIMGHIDISLLVSGEEEKEKKFEVTKKERFLEDVKELLQDLKNCIDPNYQCCDCPYNEDCDTGRENLMKEAIRVLGLFLEKKPSYEYDAESKPIGKVINKEINKEICDDGLKVTISTENVKEENEKLKKEIEAMKEALDRQKHDNDIWRQGWFECLKSLGYYLNS